MVRVADQEFTSLLHHLINFLNSRLTHARQTMKRPMENQWRWKILLLSLQLHWSQPSQKLLRWRQQSEFQANYQRSIWPKRLVSRWSTSQSISSRPAATKPTSNKMTAPDIKPRGLSKETINAIFESSCSLLNFASRLMTHLFDQSELLKCRNVFGRFDANRQVNPKEALDERRVNTIRRLVEERAAPGDYTWQQCVDSMNKKLCEIKAQAPKNMWVLSVLAIFQLSSFIKF